MGIITLPTTFVDGTIPTAAQFNGDFTAIANEFNGSISNANISASAAIALSKISGTSGQSNLTFLKPTVTASIQTITTDTDGATITFDLTASNVHVVTLADNRTLALSNAAVGQYFVIELVQDGTGSRTVTWFTTIKWAGGTAPTLTTTGGKKDIFGFRVTSSGNYDGVIIGLNI